MARPNTPDMPPTQKYAWVWLLGLFLSLVIWHTWWVHSFVQIIWALLNTDFHLQQPRRSVTRPEANLESQSPLSLPLEIIIYISFVFLLVHYVVCVQFLWLASVVVALVFCLSKKQLNTLPVPDHRLERCTIISVNVGAVHGPVTKSNDPRSLGSVLGLVCLLEVVCQPF